MSSGIKFHKVTSFIEGSSHHKLPSVNGPQVQEALKAISFTVPFKSTCKLNKEFDIPYLCGYDAKSPIIYFDKDFDPTSYHEGDATPTLMAHEEVEKALEDVTDWNYQQRHHVATHCEDLVAGSLGFDWKAYSRWTTLSWHQAYAKWKGTANLRVPPTLDMSPYVDEDEALLKAMRAAGAKDKGAEK